jgi:DNA-binding transcriptional ArsR family regulator
MSDQTRTQGRNPERGDLTLTDQRPLDADVVVEDAPIASTDLWRAIATPSDHSDFDDVLRRALQALMDDYESIPWATLAAETGLDDVLDGMVTQLLRQWTRGDEMAAWRVLRLLRQLGGPTSLGYSSSLDDVHTVVEAVFGWTDVTPTVTVVLDREFFDAKHNQRERFLRFVTGLAVGCDVRLVGTPGVLTQLAQAHDQDLPTSAVTEWTQRRRRRAATASRRRDAEAALDALGWDHPAWDTLATIAAPAAEQRPYSALYALSEVTESAVRHQLLRLDEAGLIERISLNGERVASVLPPGLEVLDLLADLRDPDGAGDPAQARLGAGGPIVSDASDAETARRLDDVNDPPKGGVGPCSPNARGTPPARPVGGRFGISPHAPSTSPTGIITARPPPRRRAVLAWSTRRSPTATSVAPLAFRTTRTATRC